MKKVKLFFLLIIKLAPFLLAGIVVSLVMAVQHLVEFFSIKRESIRGRVTVAETKKNNFLSRIFEPGISFSEDSCYITTVVVGNKIYNIKVPHDIFLKAIFVAQRNSDESFFSISVCKKFWWRYYRPASIHF